MNYGQPPNTGPTQNRSGVFFWVEGSESYAEEWPGWKTWREKRREAARSSSPTKTTARAEPTIPNPGITDTTPLSSKQTSGG